MQGKNGLHIRTQEEKSYQNDELFFLRFDKDLKMEASVNVVCKQVHITDTMQYNAVANKCTYNW